MSFEVDRYSSAWAQIALCADLTWAAEPPDEFIIANQRLWAQHCRVSQVIQDATIDSQNLQISNQCELSDKRPISCCQENGSCSSRRSVKDVIPESRLAQFYGNFYYDELREKCYTNINEKINERYNAQGCENSDVTECWMLPEVEYWFRKLLDESSERSLFPRRRRQYRMLADDDFERWDPVVTARLAGDEAVLAARLQNVRSLWAPPQVISAPAVRHPRTPSPPPAPRKMRARRRQPRRFAGLAPPPPAYCLEAPAQLLCDPTCKFQFDSPRAPQITECQRAMGRLSASVQAVMRATAARCPPYRGTNVGRYTPTTQRLVRCPDRRNGVWWPRDHPSLRLDHRFYLTQHSSNEKSTPNAVPKSTAEKQQQEVQENINNNELKKQPVTPKTPPPEQNSQQTTENSNSKEVQKEKAVVDGQIPSTSGMAIEAGIRKKRLYSTVLSMSAPAPINLTSVRCVRIPQKLMPPGLLKLNPKIIVPTAKIRPNVDNKFEELEKEALEQYKASDESIDTKFRELEKQAVEQYSTSNSNTSCSSGNSAEKKTSNPAQAENEPNKKQTPKFHKEKTVDSVVIYSQNFPDLNAKAHTTVNLKNFHTPPRGEKKEPVHRSNKNTRNFKNESQRAASDTDENNTKGNHKGSMRWISHMVPPKKRHMTVCVSHFSSDEEMEDASGSIRDARPCTKNHIAGKMKMSAHGGGDLHHMLRKT